MTKHDELVNLITNLKEQNSQVLQLNRELKIKVEALEAKVDSLAGANDILNASLSECINRTSNSSDDNCAGFVRIPEPSELNKREAIRQLIKKYVTDDEAVYHFILKECRQNITSIKAKYPNTNWGELNVNIKDSLI